MIEKEYLLHFKSFTFQIESEITQSHPFLGAKSRHRGIAKLKIEVRAKKCTETLTHEERQVMICAERTKNDQKSRDTLADEGREYF